MYRAVKMSQKGYRKSTISQPMIGIAISMETMTLKTIPTIHRTMRAMM